MINIALVIDPPRAIETNVLLRLPKISQPSRQSRTLRTEEKLIKIGFAQACLVHATHVPQPSPLNQVAHKVIMLSKNEEYTRE